MTNTLSKPLFNNIKDNLVRDSSLYSLLKDHIQLVPTSPLLNSSLTLSFSHLLSPLSSPSIGSSNASYYYENSNCGLNTTFDTNFKNLLNKEAKLIHSNLDLTRIITKDYNPIPNINFENSFQFLYNFDKEDLILVDLFFTLDINNTNLILNEIDIEFFKQNSMNPVYNFMLLTIILFVTEKYFKPENNQKKDLYSKYVYDLLYYFGQAHVLINLGCIDSCYLNISYSILNLYFNVLSLN